MKPKRVAAIQDRIFYTSNAHSLVFLMKNICILKQHM